MGEDELREDQSIDSCLPLSRFAVFDEIRRLLGFAPVEMQSLVKSLCKASHGSLFFTIGEIYIQMNSSPDIDNSGQKKLILVQVTLRKKDRTESARYWFESSEILPSME
jgi:hypothetical protein